MWFVNLDYARLSKANLRHADVARGSLRQASLEGADLRRASFKAANMTQANLLDAKMRDANFTGADLKNAILTGLNMDGVDFTRANLAERISAAPICATPGVSRPPSSSSPIPIRAPGCRKAWLRRWTGLCRLRNENFACYDSAQIRYAGWCSG